MSEMNLKKSQLETVSKHEFGVLQHDAIPQECDNRIAITAIKCVLKSRELNYLYHIASKVWLTLSRNEFNNNKIS